MMETLTVQLSKTSDGRRDYMQITSPDQVSVNIVLIADRLILDDRREEKKCRAKKLDPRIHWNDK